MTSAPNLSMPFPDAHHALLPAEPIYIFVIRKLLQQRCEEVEIDLQAGHREQAIDGIYTIGAAVDHLVRFRYAHDFEPFANCRKKPLDQ